MLVDLVDRDHDWNPSRFGVLDSLFGLRHHAVVGGDHQNHDVSCLSTTGTHGGKRLMTRCVEE